MSWQQLGPLEGRVFENDSEAPWVIMFHGYGADSADLVPLMEVAPDYNWIFPEGICDTEYGFGRAWWQIDIKALEKARMEGTFRPFSDRRPDGLDFAAELAREMIEELRPEKFVVGGFSQGAMLATELALTLPNGPMGLVALSGVLLDRNNWETLAIKRGPIPFFQSHGRSDDLLGFHQGKELEDVLLKAGWKGRLQAFEGGHEIPHSVVESLKSFLLKRIIR